MTLPRSLLSLLALLTAAVALCLAVFGTPWTAAALLLLAAALAARPRLAAPLALLLALCWKVPLHEYADRVDVLTAAPALSTRDRAGVWLLNLGMAGAGALLGLPEVALETALLALPAPRGPGPATRRFSSDFAMASPRVRAVLRGWRDGLPTRPDHARPLPPQVVSFPYDLRRESARVALALNPATLRGTARPGPGGWVLDVTATVPARYPPRYRLVLFHLDGRPIGIEEGLFARLQDDGWLHPYLATWTWTVAPGDPRLDDRAGIGQGWAEGLAARALR